MAKNSPFRECRIHNVNCEPLAGNLYGTTFLGGSTGGRECPPGCGVVFKVDLFARLGLDGWLPVRSSWSKRGNRSKFR